MMPAFRVDANHASQLPIFRQRSDLARLASSMQMASKKRAEPKPKPGKGSGRTVKRRWRDYETAAGRRPVKQFIAELSDEDAASVAAAMREVRHGGLGAARHLEGEIYEVRAGGRGVIYRILFAPQGERKQILLALEGFKKKTQKTPPRVIALAKRRLRDWERRGEEARSRLRR
jgi:phage-related protein